MTMVSDRGVSLSGGQRARINLARAVYRKADLYLLDDPLSAVDSRVARHLYWKCITEFLHGKTRILVTHQLQFLRRADHIVVLDRVTSRTECFLIVISIFLPLLHSKLQILFGFDSKVRFFQIISSMKNLILSK